MSSSSIDHTEPTNESGSNLDAKSMATNPNETSIETRAPPHGRRAKESGGTPRTSTTSAGSSKPDPAVRGWIRYEQGQPGPKEIAHNSWSIRGYSDDRSTEAKTAPESLVGESTFKFVYWHPQNNSKIPLSIAEPSRAPKESSIQSEETSAITPSSIMSDVTAWIAESAQRDPSVTLSVTGLFDLLGSEELRMDAAFVLQGSAEDGWLEFVKTMGSRYFCAGRDHVCSHIKTVPLGGHHILVGINRAKHDHRLISLLFTVRVRDGINQGSTLHGQLLRSKQRQWDSRALENSAVDWIYSVEQPLGKINPGAFEHAKTFMNEEMTAGWWIGRTEYSQDAKEQTYTYYGLRVDDGRDLEPSTDNA